MLRDQPPSENPDDPPVPGTGGVPASSRDGRRGLRLHARIAGVATLLCVFVAIVFFWLGSVVLGVVFLVIAAACVGVVLWAGGRRRRAATGRLRA